MTGFSQWRGGLAFAAIAIGVVVPAIGADDSPAALIRGNERFGRVLLEKVHSSAPKRNIAVSPVGVTITLAAIRERSKDDELLGEIDSLFAWKDAGSLAIPAQKLLQLFEPPQPPPPPGKRVVRVGRVTIPLPVSYTPNESWITNTFVYRSKDAFGRSLNPLSTDLVDVFSRYFGMKFVDTGSAEPTATVLRQADPFVTAIPKVAPGNDVWIASNTHLRTAWHGNTFSASTPFQGEFRTESGKIRQVEMLTSEAASYQHKTTDSFEAVQFFCNIATMIVVLPAPGKDIHVLERELASSPEALEAGMRSDFGEVTMPTFHIVSESQNLKRPLEEMGTRRVFQDLGDLFQIPESRVREVVQTVDFRADQQGIQANSSTVTAGVYGGLMGGKPFRMKIDRPFLFFVHGNKGGQPLLFLGAVMDPTQR